MTGFELAADDTVTAVQTDQGRIAVGEQVVIAPGPWAQKFWALLGLPAKIDIHTPSGDVVRDQPMWTYWNLQEGEITVDPLMFATADGGAPSVIHLDTDAPLYTDDGKLVTDELWGIYYKRDRHGVQGGASPLTVDGDVELDPYPSTTNVDDSFPDMWCAGLSHAMSRFEGCRALYKQARSGGVGSFTADNFPVFDYLKPNLYAILDSNHGYKMIGVGREVARILLGELRPAPDAVPLRALRNRRPAPGLALALSLELAVARASGFSRTPGFLPSTRRARRGESRRRVPRGRRGCASRRRRSGLRSALHPAAGQGSRGEPDLDEPGRDGDELDALVGEVGLRRAARREPHEVRAQAGSGIVEQRHRPVPSRRAADRRGARAGSPGRPRLGGGRRARC